MKAPVQNCDSSHVKLFNKYKTELQEFNLIKNDQISEHTLPEIHTILIKFLNEKIKMNDQLIDALQKVGKIRVKFLDNKINKKMAEISAIEKKIAAEKKDCP